MLSLFTTPTWFNGVDIIFDAVSLIVSLLIAGYAWRVYRISHENKFAYFSSAFLSVSLAFVFKIVTDAVLYYESLRNVATSVLVPVVGRTTSDAVAYSDLFYRGGFFLSMVMMLGAWLLIFFISQKKEGRLRKYYEVSQIGLFVYLVLLISVVSNLKYFVFYLTSSVLLALIVLNYYKNYLNSDRNNNAWLVMCSFLLILLGNLFFVFVFLYNRLYVLGELFVLLGFLLLLYAYRRIRK